MNNMLTKFAAIAATSATVSVAVAFSPNNPAQAIAFNYSFQTNTGYSGTGNFSYDETTAPTIISEAGAGPKDFLQSLSLSVFAPNGNLLDSGSTVVNGVSNSQFLEFKFDTLTKKLSVLDTNTSSSGNDVSYFIRHTVSGKLRHFSAGRCATRAVLTAVLFQDRRSKFQYSA
ncbi:hypothetical protein [Microseira wollei]|uniref:PEP-CTERM sorting domain-containing protein n=1 Tax=Microseira wollei NIES-4236 TaxID=2530354 RepID=A0AAV3XHX9_9CYAN|nr:hypothetical protein [Microseira wollei]GET39730.1 hypothetical protein MiSe_45020 [Microseira wollei NIES-4236]